jgi:predicted DNA-binding transcriptional regulator YafY
VRRDVDRLRSLGYPIHATAGLGGGYQLGAGKELPPLPLDDDEAVAVAVGLRAAAAGSLHGVEDASVRALAKLEQVLPKRLRRRLRALQAVSVALGDGVPGVDAEVLAGLALACRDRERVRFEYRDRDGRTSGRDVEPYRLVHTSFRWYLLAFDPVRAAWRTFRVDRIPSPPRRGERFAPRSLPSDDVAGWVSRSVAVEVYRYRARVTVAAPAEVVARKVSGVTAHIEPRDRRTCRLHTGAERLESLAFHLATLGFDFEVHEPPELVEHLRNINERLERAISRSSPAGAGPAPALDGDD